MIPNINSGWYLFPSSVVLSKYQIKPHISESLVGFAVVVVKTHTGFPLCTPSAPLLQEEIKKEEREGGRKRGKEERKEILYHSLRLTWMTVFKKKVILNIKLNTFYNHKKRFMKRILNLRKYKSM